MKKTILCAICMISILCFSACSAQTPATASEQAPSTADDSMASAEETEGQANEMVIMPYENLRVCEYETREIEVENNGRTLYGIAYIPETVNEKKPLVIYSHGLGGSHSSGRDEAQALAEHGVAAYAFDFYGGSSGSRSGGSTTEMSVMTEVDDLEGVIETAKTWDFVDPDRIVLLGSSQGGFVSSVAAARNAEDIAGAILCYPAYVIMDIIAEQFDSREDIPDIFHLNWITAGRIYAEDIWEYDAYAEIGNYKKPVLLLHGDMDTLVDLSYSERAAEVYDEAELFVIEGAGHGFNGEHLDEAMGHIFDYLQENKIVNGSGSSSNPE